MTRSDGPPRSGHRFSRLVAFAVAGLLFAPLLSACKPSPPGCKASFDVTGSCPLPPPPPGFPCIDCGSASGDPHLRTFDGVSYNMQAIGEFTAALADDLEIQIRTEKRGNNVSSVTTTAARIGDERITFTPSDGEVVVRVDGRRVRLSTDEATLVGNGTAGLDDRGRVVVAWPDGTALYIHAFGRFSSLYVKLSPDLAGHVRGLLGDFDGNKTNEFVTRDAQRLDGTPKFAEMYGAYAESWRITDDTSLFDYADGESTETFTDRSFPTKDPTVDDLTPEQRKLAERACADAGVTDPHILDECLLDVGITGDPEYALAAATKQAAYGASHLGTSAEGIVPGDQLAEIRGGEVATGDGLALVRTTSNHVTTLYAIDTQTGKTRWSAPDVDPHCRPVVVEGLGVAAQLQRGSESAGNAEPVVLLSLEDGSELARSPADESTHACTLALSASGSTVIQPSRGTVHAYDAEHGMAPLWTLDAGEIYYQWMPVVDGNVVVFARNLPTTLTVRSIDAETGDEVDSISVAGGTNRWLGVLGDGRVAAVADSAGDQAKEITVIDAADGHLSKVWSRDFAKESDLREPVQLTAIGNVVTGWSRRPDGPGLVGFDERSGKVAWTYRPSSFDNSAGMVEAVGDGNTVAITPFGGDWIELVRADGTKAGTIDPPLETYEAPAQLTALSNGRFLATGGIRDGGGIYIRFFDA